MNAMGTGIWLKQNRAAVINLVVLLPDRGQSANACWRRKDIAEGSQASFFFFKCLCSEAHFFV